MSFRLSVSGKVFLENSVTNVRLISEPPDDIKDMHTYIISTIEIIGKIGVEKGVSALCDWALISANDRSCYKEVLIEVIGTRGNTVRKIEFSDAFVVGYHENYMHDKGTGVYKITIRQKVMMLIELNNFLEEKPENVQKIPAERLSKLQQYACNQDMDKVTQIIKTSGIEEQLDYIVKNIPGLIREQANVILSEAYKRNSSVVFGGSRVRGNYTPSSDLDVGFGNLSTGQAKSIVNKASKVEGGLSIEQTRIVPGNSTDNIPTIQSPEEFFNRTGKRLYPDSRGSMDIVPSGSMTLKPNGEIIIIPPGGKIPKL